jgi:hypothetical protein
MNYSDTNFFVQDRIRDFQAEADKERRLKAAHRPVTAHPQPRLAARIVRLAQVAMMLGR